MKFTELYIKLESEAKAKYPNKEAVQIHDSSHSIAHLRVSEVFVELDMLDWEDKEGFSWGEDVSVLTDEVLRYITEGFRNYIEVIKDEEV